MSNKKTSKPMNSNDNSVKSKENLLELRVPCEPIYRGAIIGKKGSTKFRIVRKSGVKEIIVPSGDQDGDIIIKSYDKDSLYHAKRLIQDLTDECKMKKKPSVESNFLKKNATTSVTTNTSKSTTPAMEMTISAISTTTAAAAAAEAEAAKTKTKTKTTETIAETASSSLLEIKIPCEPDYRGAVIGKKGATKQKIIEATGVKDIIIPNSYHEKNIIVQGEQEASIQRAKDAILKIIKETENKKSHEPTHFLSLPLIDSSFLSRVEEFYTKWLETTADKDYVTFTMMPPACLHLTIATLCLKNDNEIKKAIEVMRSVSSEICDKLKTQPLSLKMKDLKIMKGTIDKARVVYIDVQKEQSYDLIMEVSKYLIECYRKAGVVVKESKDKPIIFHATILNTKKLNKGKFRNKNEYDATELFEQFGNTDFGDALLNNYSLCVLGTKNPKTGYKCLEKIVFSK